MLNFFDEQDFKIVHMSISLKLPKRSHDGVEYRFADESIFRKLRTVVSIIEMHQTIFSIMFSFYYIETIMRYVAASYKIELTVF